ncbi:septum formation protein Maf [Solemya pervernicosa gill symbiont]|uniref:dTTP/UTP pyrophosphatase n=2 Tax=Gammaproteobacteria incertae sedis TaxID=118884 RepID=A0A1T2L756_9GAMM|nr:nucleoside triphosphate pyrophosphatase [Candidatus Reidiella endopervernicosa]OOZ40890.1 septum formation protein Maf [Solemya pervernicosa gill symbiont]QKQ26140.1 septum formation inhibitor Maf [Candidatus Reidiella endopervernicosa]
MTPESGAPDLYLASASPRRAELLTQLKLDFEVLRVDVPELIDAGESAEVFAIRVALDKARAGLSALEYQPGRPVLGADTCVVVEGRVLGKPRDREHAAEMMHLLSGCEHRVMTSVAVVNGEREQTRLSVSHVHFRELSESEIGAYWETGEPLGKAGGYAVQGQAAQFIERLEGSYSGVMGLPLYETAELLTVFGVGLL